LHHYIKNQCSVKTIQRRLDSVKTNFNSPISKNAIVGLMLIKDSITSQSLLKYYVKYQKNSLYLSGIEELKKKVTQF
jgi:hypothetical protein